MTADLNSAITTDVTPNGTHVTFTMTPDQARAIAVTLATGVDFDALRQTNPERADLIGYVAREVFDDLPTRRSFMGRQHDAAWAYVGAEGRLRRFLDHETCRMGGRRVGQVVTIQGDPEFDDDGTAEAALGVYAVEVIERMDKTTERSMWAVVSEGVSDSSRWYTVDQALLHAIALRKGQRDGRGGVNLVTYASRVLGFDDFAGRD